MDRDMQLPTILTLPPSLPYPVTITKLHVKPGAAVKRGQKLISYTYAMVDRDMATVDSTQYQNDADRDGNGEGREESGGAKGGARVRLPKRVGPKIRKAGGDWDSPLEGEVVQWEDGIKEGVLIGGSGRKAIYIQEPCSHPVVFSGLCGICGKDLDELHGYLDSSNSPFASDNGAGPSRQRGSGGVGYDDIVDDSYRGGLAIDHEDARVKVSVEEAHRLAQIHRNELLKSHKLIMVVDLDQTIIHAAVDPTIGEWLNECGFWESSKLGNGKKSHQDGKEKSPSVPAGGDKSSGDTAQKGKESPHQEEPSPSKRSNPNKEALKDVFRFQLPNELPPGFGKGRFSQILPEEDGDGCWYYVKPRPGLVDFLRDMSELYELHVYTAGSRTYANAVCKGLDPDGRYFGDRILSRDESGNAAQKTLKRLFPADQSMVVVIDDRYEVWNHAANLVKVVPYDFFVGMGDINSAFVAPRAIDETPTRPESGVTELKRDESVQKEVLIPVDADRESISELQQAQAIEEQLMERPLAKRQAELEKERQEDRSTTPEGEPVNVAADAAETRSDTGGPPKALLKADDGELPRLQHILKEIHGRFYAAFAEGKDGYRIPPSIEPNPKVMYDVRHIIPHMQRKILGGCHIVFSGIVPLNMRPEQNEYWVLATTFGAKCSHHLGPGVTHLVTAQADTQKVYQAHRLPNTKVVWKEWLRHSIDLWQRQPEEPYLVPKPANDKEKNGAPSAPKATDEGVETAPATPSPEVGRDDSRQGDQDVDQDGHLHLNVDEDDMDAEMAAFLAESDSEMGSEDSDSVRRDGRNTPRRKRPRGSQLANEIYASATPTPEPANEGVLDQPFHKRAKFAADSSDIATEFADMEAEHDVENYDEYPDEDGRVDENQSEVEAPPRDILMEETAEENGGEPSQQLQQDLAKGQADEAVGDERMQGRTHANPIA